MNRKRIKTEVFLITIISLNIFVFSSFSPSAVSAQTVASLQTRLTLEYAELISLKDEPGLMSQKWQSQSLQEQAIAVGQLMDPKIQVGLSNLPTDSFNFSQENMTQFKVGVTQQFPPGKTLDLRQQKKLKQSQLVLAKIAERKLSIVKEVRLNYLEIYYWEQAKNTIQKNKKFFSQLVDTVQSLFSVGRNNQQDLIRAQLELSRLEERLVKITQKINRQRSKLSRWIGTKNSYTPLAQKLPTIEMPVQLQSLSSKIPINKSFEQLSQLFYHHPKIQEVDQQIEVSRKDIALATEAYKSGWGLNVSYANRGNNPNGLSRSDFISVGVSFDLPLFTANRQDKNRLAKEYAYQALIDKRLELLHQLVAELQQEISIEKQLGKRHQLYNRLLLPQAKQQTTASLLAYQSDRGDFADVMRAYIDNLNVHLDEQRIAVDHLQSRAKMLYFIPGESTMRN